MTVYDELAQEMARKFIDGLNENNGEWSKGFVSLATPFNPVSGTRYAGVSRLILMYKAGEYGDPRFVTFKQALSGGGHVCKGEKGIRCVRWQPVVINKRTKERVKKRKGEKLGPDEEEKLMPLPYTVFNVRQTEGLDLPPFKLETLTSDERNRRVDALIKQSGAQIRHEEMIECGSYNFKTDVISMPKFEQYESAGRYYDTLLHELSHWTGHESRLNRKFDTFGSENYAKEELRAEIGSAMLCAELGVEHNLGNNKEYVKHWAEILKDKPTEIFKAAADAAKICEFIMKFDLTRKQEFEKVSSKEMVYVRLDRDQIMEREFVRDNFPGRSWDRKAKLWRVPFDTSNKNNAELLKLQVFKDAEGREPLTEQDKAKLLGTEENRQKQVNEIRQSRGR